MTQDARHQIVGECAYLAGDSGNPGLEVLQVAIHLEEALGVTLPAHVLDVAHLGSAEAIENTLTDIGVP